MILRQSKLPDKSTGADRNPRNYDRRVGDVRRDRNALCSNRDRNREALLRIGIVGVCASENRILSFRSLVYQRFVEQETLW